jgi:hypothetical protein
MAALRRSSSGVDAELDGVVLLERVALVERTVQLADVERVGVAIDVAECLVSSTAERDSGEAACERLLARSEACG